MIGYIQHKAAEHKEVADGKVAGMKDLLGITEGEEVVAIVVYDHHNGGKGTGGSKGIDLGLQDEVKSKKGKGKSGRISQK